MSSTAFPSIFPGLDAAFFRGLNQVAEPLIRAGLWGPWLSPIGAIVVETTGRESGRTLKVPLMAFEFGDMVVVSTVRTSSQWIKNLAANPEVRYWIRGKSRDAKAVVVGLDDKQNEAALPGHVEGLARLLRAQSRFCGARYAILY